MENFREKMGMKTFWSVFGWVERIKLNGGTHVFSPLTHQKVLSKIERKLKRKIRHHFWTKMPMCSSTWACPRCSTFFFLFSFSFSFLLHVVSYYFFLFIFWQASYTSMLIFFFLFLFRCVFF